MPQRFEGVLFQIGRASWKSLKGARTHRVLLNRKVTEESIGQLVGLPIWDCCPISKTHLNSVVVGFIDKAFIDGIKVCIEGFMTNDVIPSVQASGSPENLGLSFDALQVHIRDMSSYIWEVDKITFTGATVLPQASAAFGTDTSFRIIGE